jgi:hypothetical protein
MYCRLPISLGGAQLLPAGRNQRLMRVQRDRARAPDPRERIAALRVPGSGGHSLPRSACATTSSARETFGTPSIVSGSFTAVKLWLPGGCILMSHMVVDA